MASGLQERRKPATQRKSVYAYDVAHTFSGVKQTIREAIETGNLVEKQDMKNFILPIIKKKNGPNIMNRFSLVIDDYYDLDEEWATKRLLSCYGKYLV